MDNINQHSEFDVAFQPENNYQFENANQHMMTDADAYQSITQSDASYMQAGVFAHMNASTLPVTSFMATPPIPASMFIMPSDMAMVQTDSQPKYDFPEFVEAGMSPSQKNPYMAYMNAAYGNGQMQITSGIAVHGKSFASDSPPQQAQRGDMAYQCSPYDQFMIPNDGSSSTSLSNSPHRLEYMASQGPTHGNIHSNFAYAMNSGSSSGNSPTRRLSQPINFSHNGTNQDQPDPMPRRRLPETGNHQDGMAKLERVSGPAKIQRSRKTSLESSEDGDHDVDADDGHSPVKKKKRSEHLEKNRMAAQKCREKKRNTSAVLEAHCSQMSRENAEYKTQIQALRNDVTELKMLMLNHSPSDPLCTCTDIHEWNAKQASVIQAKFLASLSLQQSQLQQGQLQQGQLQQSQLQPSQLQSSHGVGANMDVDQGQVFGQI